MNNDWGELLEVEEDVEVGNESSNRRDDSPIKFESWRLAISLGLFLSFCLPLPDTITGAQFFIEMGLPDILDFSVSLSLGWDYIELYIPPTVILIGALGYAVVHISKLAFGFPKKQRWAAIFMGIGLFGTLWSMSAYIPMQIFMISPGFFLTIGCLVAGLVLETLEFARK